MATEPIEDVVRLVLEGDGYLVRTNVRFKVHRGYSDLDLIAVRLDPRTGRVADRLWGEVKAHLTSELSAAYLRGFSNEYAALLRDAALSDRSVVQDEAQERKLRARQSAAHQRVEGLLGPRFRRCLYFGGRKAGDGGEGAAQLLHPELEVVYISELMPQWIANLDHAGGNEPLVRMINALSSYGLLP